MTARPVTIIDQGRKVVATAVVQCLAGRYSGPVDVGPMPTPLRLVFEEYEAIVNDQIFSLLDRIEGKVSAIPLTAVFGDGREGSVEDLQIFPKGGTVAFRLAGSTDDHSERSALA
jgi:hypothetical protein